MADSHSTSTLNDLIATTLDSVDGYRKAAEKADSGRYGEMFRQFADDREGAVRMLQAQVRAYGEEPEDDGTVLAAAHRAFLSLKDAMTGSNDKAIIDEVERGEDHIKAKYERALQDTALDGDARRVIEQAYASVRRGHDSMRDLKHSLEHSDRAG